MKTKKYFSFLILYFSFLSQVLIAQSPDWLWAKGLRGDLTGFSYSIAIDVTGNVYTVGAFSGTTDFNPGSGVFNLTGIGNDRCAFISKIDQTGNFVWAKSFKGGTSVSCFAIAIDASNNIYTTGVFTETVDFDPNPGVFNMTSAGIGDVFICKLDSLGNFLWAKSFEGVRNTGSISLVIDKYKNVYTSGSFFGTVDFDPDINSFFNLYADSNRCDIFISKLDSSGNFLWAKDFGGIQSSVNSSIVIDPFDKIYLTGNISGVVDFDPGMLTFNLNGSGNGNAYISKLDSSGNFVWAKMFAGTLGSGGASIITDSLGSVYTTGGFTGTIDLDPDSFGIYLQSSNSDWGVFLSKLDSSGNFVWAKTMVGTPGSKSHGISIALSAVGNIFIAGSFGGTVDFDPDSGISNLDTSDGNIFICKLNNLGNFLWVNSFGGQSNITSARTMAVDVFENLLITGYFYAPTINFDLINIINQSDPGYTDIFIAKMGNIINGIEQINFYNNINIFPNPTDNLFSINLLNNQKEIEIKIINMSGKFIYKKNVLATKKIEVNTSGFPVGIYLVQIKTSDFIETKKLIITR